MLSPQKIRTSHATLNAHTSWRHGGNMRMCVCVCSILILRLRGETLLRSSCLQNGEHPRLGPAPHRGSLWELAAKATVRAPSFVHVHILLKQGGHPVDRFLR